MDKSRRFAIRISYVTIFKVICQAQSLTLIVHGRRLREEG